MPRTRSVDLFTPLFSVSHFPLGVYFFLVSIRFICFNFSFLTLYVCVCMLLSFLVLLLCFFLLFLLLFLFFFFFVFLWVGFCWAVMRFGPSQSRGRLTDRPSVSRLRISFSSSCRSPPSHGQTTTDYVTTGR